MNKLTNTVEQFPIDQIRQVPDWLEVIDAIADGLEDRSFCVEDARGPEYGRIVVRIENYWANSDLNPYGLPSVDGTCFQVIHQTAAELFEDDWSVYVCGIKNLKEFMYGLNV